MAIQTGIAPILITGGTGKTGRRIADRLRTAGHAVRIGSRSAIPAFDWNDPAGWDACLAGVDKVYVSYQPDLAVPGAVETVSRFFQAAVDHGVSTIVLLSGRGEVEAEQAEAALQAHDINWTILRASWFCQNFSESYFLEPILAGELALPVGDVAEPFIDADDIADVAFVALTTPHHVRRLYELSGPEALTFAQAIAGIAAASGRTVRFVPIWIEDFRAGLAEQGVPAGEIALLVYLFTRVLDGRNTPVVNGVQEALGRPATAFATYARRAAAAGAWDSPANRLEARQA